jgi:hypothetical protein
MTSYSDVNIKGAWSIVYQFGAEMKEMLSAYGYLVPVQPSWNVKSSL